MNFIIIVAEIDVRCGVLVLNRLNEPKCRCHRARSAYLRDFGSKLHQISFSATRPRYI